MTTKSFNQTLAFVAGTLADAIRPGAPPRIVPAANNSLANRKIYLADNSRLRADADRERVRAEVVRQQHGLAAEWPSEHFLLPAGHSIADRRAVGLPLDGDQEPGRALRKAWRWIGKCDAIVAEVTPFRGDHMNPVIAFEIGVAVALEIPVFAWTGSVYPAPGAPGRTRPRLLDDAYLVRRSGRA